MDGKAGPSSPRRAEGMSALRQRLPGQRTPPDPSVEQPNAADLTYGWHKGTDSGDDRHAASEEEWVEDEFTDAEEQEEPDDQRLFADRPAATAWGISGSRLGSSSWLWRRWRRRAERPTDENRPEENVDERPAEETHTENSFICRICFDGPGSTGEGGESLGKLIAPCRCRGTMKFVHQRCLKRWRSTSQRQSSVMQCDQCGAPYRFKKSPFVGMATNRALLLLMSCVLFVSLVWSVGFAAELAVRRMEVDGPATSSGSAAKKSTSWWPFGGDDGGSAPSRSRLYQNIDLGRSGYDTDDVYGDSFFDYRYDYRYVYSEPAAYVTLIKAAVKYVGSGQAFQHLFRGEAAVEVIADEDQVIGEGHSHKGWWATLKDDWLYGRGGIWEGQRPASAPEESAVKDAIDPATESGAPRSQEDLDGSKANRYDAINARNLAPGEQPVRPVARERRSATATKGRKQPRRASPSSTWLERLTLQLSLGASLVGMSSFLSLLLGISTWGPFHLNLGLGRGFARVARRRGGGGRGGGGGGGGGGSEGEALVAVFLLFLVIVGIIRALFAVYGVTTYISRRLLTRVEDIILDWGQDEGDGGEPAVDGHGGGSEADARMREQLGARLGE